MGFWDGSGIRWTICKQSAPRSRQITTPTPHHSIFTGQVLFLMLNQQCQSTVMVFIRSTVCDVTKESQALFRNRVASVGHPDTLLTSAFVI